MLSEDALKTETECFKYLISVLYPDGFRCIKCGSNNYWIKAERRIIICRTCRKEVSPLSGTLFSGSHLSLSVWLNIIRMVTCSKDRVITARYIYRELNLGSYRTAWEALKKIRFAISTNEPRRRLGGLVEFDEMVISGQISDYGKVSIFGVLEIEGRKRLSLQMIRNPDEMNIKDYFQKRFKRDVTVITDPEKLYIRNWLELNRIRQVSSVSKYGMQFMNLHIILQDVRYGLRNGHHSVSEQNLQENLDEYVFVFNHNDDRERAFGLLVEYMLKTPIKKYKQEKRKRK